jgi:hypothetical protein
VYERTPGAMDSRGAGIVVQDDLLRLLRRHDAPDLPISPINLMPGAAVAISDIPQPAEWKRQ